MSIIVTGSIAYDYLMSFPGRFSEHILADEVEHVSLSFLVDSLHKRRGGCAPNIAFSLALLGERPTIMGTAGQDFGEYRAWLEAAGVDTSLIVEIEDEYTSSYFVNTDLENNQIGSFYAGAMARAATLSFRDLDHGSVEMAIISPNDPAAMTKYVAECQALGIPYIYDPSFQVIYLTGDELQAGASEARLVIVNEYEFGMMKGKTGLSDEDLLALPQATIITRGGDGSTVYTKDEVLTIPVVPPETTIDPTGVGDAYRAGIIRGMLSGYPWLVSGRLGALAATYVLEHGTQNQHYTRAEFVARYRRVFGDTPELASLLDNNGP